MIFKDWQLNSMIFQTLKMKFIKFHDCPGFPWPVRTQYGIFFQTLNYYILKDSNSLALRSRHRLFSGRREKSRGQANERGRKEESRLRRAAFSLLCVFPSRGVNQRLLRRLKIHRSSHSTVNPRTFIRIQSIHFRFRIQNLRRRTRPNRDVSVSDSHIFGERRETNSGVPKWWIPKNLL